MKLTAKNIKSMSLPKISSEVRLLASQEFKPYVITANKKDGTIIFNIFQKIDEVECVYRFFVNPEKEYRLYDLKAGKVTRSSLNGKKVKTDRGYDWVFQYATFTCSEKELTKIQKWTGYEYYIKSIISRLEDKIQYINAKKRENKREEEFKKQMDSVKAVPKSLDAVEKKQMSFSNYIFFNKKEKNCYCTKCKQENPISRLPKGFKHLDYAKCPSCKRNFQLISDGKRKTMKPDESMNVVIQANGKHRLIIRYFNVSYSYRESRDAKVRRMEQYRTFMDFDKHTSVDYINHPFRGWSKPKAFMYNTGYTFPFLKGDLVRAGLKTEMKKADLDSILSNHEEMAELIADKWSWCTRYTCYIEKVALAPGIELLSKAGFTTLVREILLGPDSYSYEAQVENNIQIKKKTLLEILGAKDKAQLREMRERNVKAHDLHFIHLHNDVSKVTRSVDEILSLKEEFDGSLKYVFGLSQKQVTNLRKYKAKVLEKETKMSSRQFNRFYMDYMHDAQTLEYNMNSSIVLYPRDLMKAHDDAFKNVKYKKNEADYAKIAPLLEEMHKMFDFKDELANLMITAPNHGREITDEGQILGHCVGGYVSRVADKQTTILFVRKLDQPDVPFYTMEVQGNKIRQLYGKGNCKPTEEVSAFVESFKKAKKIA